MEEISLPGSQMKNFHLQGGISSPKEAWGESSGVKISVPKLDLGGNPSSSNPGNPLGAGAGGYGGSSLGGNSQGGNVSRTATATARGGTMGVGAEALILPSEGVSDCTLPYPAN